MLTTLLVMYVYLTDIYTLTLTVFLFTECTVKVNFIWSVDVNEDSVYFKTLTTLCSQSTSVITKSEGLQHLLCYKRTCDINEVGY